MLVRRFNAPVRNGLLVEEPTQAPLKPWPVRPPYEPSRHYGYALQWVLIGLGFLVAAGMTWKGRHGKS
jgi:cytochrome oxidase assembly protein ShyY1